MYNGEARVHHDAFEFVTSSINNEYNIVIHADRKENNTEHQGRYGAFTTNEVEVVVVNQVCEKHDIVLHARDDRIAETHRTCSAL